MPAEIVGMAKALYRTGPAGRSQSEAGSVRYERSERERGGFEKDQSHSGSKDDPDQQASMEGVLNPMSMSSGL